MSRTYSCPQCQAILNPEHAVMVLADHAGRRVLIGLHPEPGNYETFLPPGFVIERGTRWNFHCPACRGSLTSTEDRELCGVDLMTEGRHEKVLFSAVAGEEATFVVGEGGQREAFGRDFKKYLREVGWGPGIG